MGAMNVMGAITVVEEVRRVLEVATGAAVLRRTSTKCWALS